MSRVRPAVRSHPHRPVPASAGCHHAATRSPRHPKPLLRRGTRCLPAAGHADPGTPPGPRRAVASRPARRSARPGSTGRRAGRPGSASRPESGRRDGPRPPACRASGPAAGSCRPTPGKAIPHPPASARGAPATGDACAAPGRRTPAPACSRAGLRERDQVEHGGRVLIRQWREHEVRSRDRGDQLRQPVLP